MGARARGFLLFSFAFSSVLSSPEIPASSPAPLNSSCPISGTPCVEKREVKYDSSTTATGSENAVRSVVRDGMEKRARVGFTGMRGKKYDWEEGAGIEDLNGFLADLILDKRARMMGFNGMRGRKRGPMAFHGMRGKKSDEYDGFDGYEAEPDLAEYDGFPDDPDESIGDSWEKRTMAFHGMRGRKRQDGEMTRPSLYDEGDDSGYHLKRAMGFLGMRGKKSPETWSWDEYNKRGARSGFFGMKGKKAQSGFFGMRGKKSSGSDYMSAPGERDLSFGNEPHTLSSLGHPMISTQDRVRRGTSWLRNSKKAKNAFFAVRGKKTPRFINVPGSEFDLISSSSE